MSATFERGLKMRDLLRVKPIGKAGCYVCDGLGYRLRDEDVDRLEEDAPAHVCTVCFPEEEAREHACSRCGATTVAGWLVTTRSLSAEVIRLRAEIAKAARERNEAIEAQLAYAENGLAAFRALKCPRCCAGTGRVANPSPEDAAMKTASQHPNQRVEKDAQGRYRFVQNKIVRTLLDQGPFDMNKLAVMDFNDEDRTQFTMLIGYTVEGLAELSYADQKMLEQADRAVELLEQGVPVAEPERLVPYDGFPEGVTDGFAAHAAKTSSQYDTTCRALAGEVVRLRAEIAEARAHATRETDRADTATRERDEAIEAQLAYAEKITDACVAIRDELRFDSKGYNAVDRCADAAWYIAGEATGRSELAAFRDLKCPRCGGTGSIADPSPEDAAKGYVFKCLDCPRNRPSLRVAEAIR